MPLAQTHISYIEAAHIWLTRNGQEFEAQKAE